MLGGVGALEDAWAIAGIAQVPRLPRFGAESTAPCHARPPTPPLPLPPRTRSPRMRFPSPPLSKRLLALQIFGANTNVGKTIFSVLLARSARSDTHVHYLKPISTGSQSDADEFHLSRFADKTTLASVHTLLQYGLPISPHLATPNPPDDADVLGRVTKYIETKTHEARLEETWDLLSSAGEKNRDEHVLLLETAGGVHTPTLRGTSQADFYRPLRLPVILVADSKLGGISTTLAAWESLHVRGYDVTAVLCFQGAYHQNAEYLRSFFAERGIPLHTAPPPPPKGPTVNVDDCILRDYYQLNTNLQARFSMLWDHLRKGHRKRIADLNGMAEKAASSIWYPFTQHKLIRADEITPIDSAYGDFFSALAPPTSDDASEPASLLNPMFDGSASWWTQGLGHGNPRLALAAAHAAGRYGHVMFAGTIHEPALKLAQTLLKHMPGSKLTRCFYSDNGSTGTEVAVKMALRATRKRYGLSADTQLGVLGLAGAYHGDTIGAMDCAEPGVFNSEVEWYRGRGFWFNVPTVGMKSGVWHVTVPEEIRQELGTDGEEMSGGLTGVFDLEARKSSKLAEKYAEHIRRKLQHLSMQGQRFGALMLEPVVLGAGGMLFVDPLFQRTLVDVVQSMSATDLFAPPPKPAEGLLSLFMGPKPPPSPEAFPPPPPPSHVGWTGLPVIADEVFTGLFRLGHFSSSALLGVEPDITVHAKLLTGGLVPLAATLASESIFKAFLSDDKKDALLHGHSYTAHAVGCSVAIESLRQLLALHRVRSSDEELPRVFVPNRTLSEKEKEARKQRLRDIALEKELEENMEENSGKEEEGKAKAKGGIVEGDRTWSMWSRGFVEYLSFLPTVRSVWALGSVLAVRLEAADGAGELPPSFPFHYFTPPSPHLFSSSSFHFILSFSSFIPPSFNTSFSS